MSGRAFRKSTLLPVFLLQDLPSRVSRTRTGPDLLSPFFLSGPDARFPMLFAIALVTLIAMGDRVSCGQCESPLFPLTVNMTGDNPQSVATTDINGDGWADIITANMVVSRASWDSAKKMV